MSGTSPRGGLTKGEILRIVRNYIGVEGGYLCDFTYKGHTEFYPLYCDLDLDPFEYLPQGTTRERFILVLEQSPPDVQAKILRGLLAKCPPASSPLRTVEAGAELLAMADRLEGAKKIYSHNDVGSGPPAQKPRVARQFQRELDVRNIDVPDWQFITHVAELFERYASSDFDDGFSIKGGDTRGTYDARDLEAFRQEHAERDEDLSWVTIQTMGRDENGFHMFTLHCRAEGHGHADFQGEDEVLVNGVAARVSQLADAAKARLRAKDEVAAETQREASRKKEVEASSPTSVEFAPATGTPQTRPWNHPWVITVLGGALAAVIAGVVLYVLLH